MSVGEDAPSNGVSDCFHSLHVVLISDRAYSMLCKLNSDAHPQ